MAMTAPFQGFPPELLAQIAHGAFRPPQAMGGGAPGMGMPQQGGGDGGLGAGMAGLGMGLGMLGKMGAGGGAPGAGAMPGEDRAKAPQWPPPMGDTTTTVQPSSGGNDFWSWLPWK